MDLIFHQNPCVRDIPRASGAPTPSEGKVGARAASLDKYISIKQCRNNNKVKE